MEPAIIIPVTVYLSEDTLHEFDLACVRRGTSMSEVLRDLIERHIEEELYANE